MDSDMAGNWPKKRVPMTPPPRQPLANPNRSNYHFSFPPPRQWGNYLQALEVLPSTALLPGEGRLWTGMEPEIRGLGKKAVASGHILNGS